MIAKYNRISFVFGIPGILLQILGRAASLETQDPAAATFYNLVTLAGTGLLLVGLAYYARAKGRNPAWCLMAFLSCIGLIILACLKDEATGRR